MHPRDIRIQDYTYSLPDERIAKYPAEQRDASKLLVYKDGTITDDSYRNIAAQIPAGALMVFNQSKVIHARLLFKKPSGGVIEVFCLSPRDMDIHSAMQQRGQATWECLIGGAGKWKHGMVLQLRHDAPAFTLSARISERTAAAYVVTLEWDDPSLTFAEILHHAGKVPLPPYLHRDADVVDEERYQTLFAAEEGSVAAPTAGLHFTNDILNSLRAKNINTTFVTLHVGAGTFKPVKAETMAGHEMHEEWIEVSYDTVQQLIANTGNKIIAVGTTSLRTIESLYWIGNKMHSGKEVDLHGVAVAQWEPYETVSLCTPHEALSAVAAYMAARKLNKLVTRTQILIAPGYQFNIVNGLATNFHQPQSTLLLLIAAFIGDDWRQVYDHALNHNYRFLSYGDGSLLWR
jgi:S-adenosylmethionine:tRNA ribosyltransferase-isomerase